MQETRIHREIPQSELRGKLEQRLRERGIEKSLSSTEIEDRQEKFVKNIFGIGLCWIICIVLGTFIYVNTFLNNNFSQSIISSTESYLDGSKDIDNYWNNFRNRVYNLRSSSPQGMD